MQALALCLLAAALLAAGCAQPATPTPSSPSATSPSSPGPTPRGGTVVAPPHGENATGGLRLAGDAIPSGIYRGGTIRLSYAAANEGANATTHGACERPYAFTLRDANGTQHPLEVPASHCLAISYDPFPHGARMEFNTTWDGTYAAGDHLVQAPPGSYRFTATFTAWRGGQPAAVSLTLPVNILSRPGQG